MYRTGRLFYRSVGRSVNPLLSRSSSTLIRSIPTIHRINNTMNNRSTNIISSSSSSSILSSSSSSILSLSASPFSPLCSSLSPPSCGTDDEGRIGGPHRSIHSFSSSINNNNNNKLLSPDTTSLSSSISSSSSSSPSSFDDILDPSNPPVLSLTHYHLLLNRLSEKTAENNNNNNDTNNNLSSSNTNSLSTNNKNNKNNNNIKAKEDEEGEVDDDLKELFREGGQGRTLMEQLERLSDQELSSLIAAQEINDTEEIDPLTEPKKNKNINNIEGDKKLYDTMTNSSLFNQLSEQLGVNSEHLKQLSAYALLMRRKLADSLGLIPSDIERISESGRLSQHLLRIVESELSPSHSRFSGLVSDQDLDVLSLGTLGSTATMARLSAVSEWQSSYHPRKLTSRSNRMKYCKICIGEANRDPRYMVAYTNVELLHSFINERGKIVGRRHTRVCAKHQRRLQKEIKRARNMALLGWLSDWKVPDTFVQEFYGDSPELQKRSQEIEAEKDEEEKERIRYRRSIGITDRKKRSNSNNLVKRFGLDDDYDNINDNNNNDDKDTIDPLSMSIEDKEKLIRNRKELSEYEGEELEDRLAEIRRSVFTREQRLIGRRREQTINESFVAEELEESLQRMDELYQDNKEEMEKRRLARTVYHELSQEDKDMDADNYTDSSINNIDDTLDYDMDKQLSSFRKEHELDPAQHAQQVNNAKRNKKK